jgi:hypothetical protein
MYTLDYLLFNAVYIKNSPTCLEPYHEAAFTPQERFLVLISVRGPVRCKLYIFTIFLSFYIGLPIFLFIFI